MNPVERAHQFPNRYGRYFADVFKGEKGEYERGYGKYERYRLSYTNDEDGLHVGLDSIKYDSDYAPQYTRVYEVDELSDDTEVHRTSKLSKGQIPYEAYTQPEFVLRSLLHALQGAIKARLE